MVRVQRARGKRERELWRVNALQCEQGGETVIITTLYGSPSPEQRVARAPWRVGRPVPLPAVAGGACLVRPAWAVGVRLAHAVGGRGERGTA